MAKAKTILLLGWISILIGSCNIHQPDLNVGGIKTELVQTKKAVSVSSDNSSNLRKRIIKTAIGEIGVKEERGNNRGKRIGEYLATTGLPQGHPWCAAFAKWIFDQNQIPTPGATAWSPTWFPDSRTVWMKGDDPKGVIESGDTFGLYYSNLKRIGHIGIVERIDNGWIYTIEGNTGSDQGRDGDVVRRHRRSIKQVSVISNWIDQLIE